MRLEGRRARARLWKSSSCAMVPRRAREDHRYSGAGTDEPLSSAGERALRELACDRDVFRVITSGMARTDQTARILFPNAELWHASVCARWISVTSRGEAPPSLKRMCATAPG